MTGEQLLPVEKAGASKPVAWRTEYRDVYRGRDTGWNYYYHTTEPNPAPLTRDGFGHRNKIALYEHPATTPTALPGAEDVASLVQRARKLHDEARDFVSKGVDASQKLIVLANHGDLALSMLPKLADLIEALQIPRASDEVPANPVGEGLVAALDGAEAISINKGKSVVIDFDKSGQAFALYNILLKAALSADAASSQEQGASGEVAK